MQYTRAAILALAAIFFMGLSLVQAAHDASAELGKPSDIPVEAFAALPSFDSPKLSPSGKKLAYFVELEGRRHLIIQNLDGSDPVIIPPQDKVEYDWFTWKSDDVILFQLGLTANRWEFRGKSSETRMVSLHIPEKEFTWLGRPKGRKGERYSQFDSLVDLLPDDPDHILLKLDFELDGYPDVYKVDVKSGRRSIVQRGSKGINHWMSDQNGEVRLGGGYRVLSTVENMKYKTDAGDWIDLTRLDWTEKYEFEGFTTEPDTFYVSGPSEYGTSGIFKLNALSGQITDTVFAHKDYDIRSVFTHPVTNRLAGVGYTGDYYSAVYFDEDLALLHRSMQLVMPNTRNSIASKARDKELYLFNMRSDSNPGDYYLYDRESKQLAYLISERRQIDERIMASTQPVNIPVRNGTHIPGYMTVPYGMVAKNLPSIILPHGGPEARDTAEWDYEAQFYASRGWLVLKPNFRGSTGYGPAYHEAGHNQWGGLMQDDVTDATKWLITEGMADPNRICIVGGSYGGYAALMGVVKEPGLYKCAVSVNGVSDIPNMKEHDRKYIGGRAWIKNMGLEGADDKDVSPYHRAEDISAPVLLIAAKDDARVPYKQSKSMHGRLKKLGKESQYVELKTGTHHMVTTESRLIMLRETEKFLKEYIGN